MSPFLQEPAILILTDEDQLLRMWHQIFDVIFGVRLTFEQEHTLVAPSAAVLHVIGTRFPSVLAPYFSDVVDLLVGWSMEVCTHACISFLISSFLEERSHLAIASRKERFIQSVSPQ